ncbi:uncharacterized protein LOC124252779 isoform X3 [Haliotis rubra]|uniref:uncharacterized protein LOC124252779 isoform X1 n=1 Tax=Haliotis rubra TaxID=36100 RepID=UPI001EE5529B|nr:uncharacterized protein LOC124252779 isoform X1 [Haliotis rubra]XP_046542412.1 uncharacterized protein LOC124252779 isoform X3 [Haliotis rubra]
MASMGIPSPKEQIACQLLLKQPECRHSSWLRKQSFRNKVQLFRWPQVFVVLSGGCLYYYRNETAKTPAGSFSLYGYNSVVRASDIPPSEAPWALRVIHTHQEYKTYLFSASSEIEMKDWMKKIKKEMKMANNQNIRSAADGQDDDNSSETYQDIETKIYEDPHSFVIPTNYSNRKKDDFTDDDDLYRLREPAAPPVPPREGARTKKAEMHTTKTVQDLSKELHSKLDLTKMRSRGGYIKGTAGETKRPKRGSPEGASIKQKTTEVAHGAIEDEEEEEYTPEKYWSAIHFVGTEKEKASDIIRQLGEDGVYLIRDGAEGGKVLVVFAGDIPRKFKIEYQSSYYFLNSKKDVYFQTLEELMRHYYDENLPGYKVTLSTPFQLHPKFKPHMM